jgi:hypothetical protein
MPSLVHGYIASLGPAPKVPPRHPARLQRFCSCATKLTMNILKPLRLPSHSEACTFSPSTNTLCYLAVLINPHIDTIYLPGYSQLPLGYNPWLSRSDVDFNLIRPLAVDVGWSRPWRTGFDERISVGEIVSD